jgi:SHOCT-like protein
MSKDQIKEERMKILELLSKGVVSADEAEKLLAALGHNEPDAGQEIVVAKKKAPFKMLKVLVDSNDGDKVRIQIPVEFSKLLKTSKFKSNIGDADIDIDAILEMISQGVDGELVNIESGDGDIIKIVVE